MIHSKIISFHHFLLTKGFHILWILTIQNLSYLPPCFHVYFLCPSSNSHKMSHMDSSNHHLTGPMNSHSLLALPISYKQGTVDFFYFKVAWQDQLQSRWDQSSCTSKVSSFIGCSCNQGTKQKPFSCFHYVGFCPSHYRQVANTHTLLSL